MEPTRAGSMLRAAHSQSFNGQLDGLGKTLAGEQI
jgi:hypothetical protein